MPCFTIAVVRATIKAEHTVELLAGPSPLKAFTLSLIPVLGREPTVLSVIEGVEAVLQVGDLQILVTRDGITCSSRSRTRSEVQEISEKVVKTATALAIPLAIERTVSTVKSRYGKLAIQADTRQGNNRVVKLRIPVR